MATGRITTTIESSAAEVKEPSKELLKISKGEGTGTSSSEAAQNEIRAMQENAIAREKELNEANERIALLENNQDKIIRPMQENLIAMEKTLNEANERIALLEKNVEDLKHLLELKSLTMAKAQEQAENKMPDAELSSSTAAGPPTKEEEPSVEGDESSLFNWQWLWGAVILLPIAGWGWKHWKASKNDTSKFSDTY